MYRKKNMTYCYDGEIREVRTFLIFGKNERNEQRENELSERKNGNLKLKTAEKGRRKYGKAICEKSGTSGDGSYVDSEMEEKNWDERKWTETSEERMYRIVICRQYGVVANVYENVQNFLLNPCYGACRSQVCFLMPDYLCCQ